MAHDKGGLEKDADIVQLLRSGRLEDLVLGTEMTVERYKERICGFIEAAYPGLTFHDIEDISQRTIDALLRKIAKGTFSDEGNFAALLYKIAECFAISAVRSMSRSLVDGAVDVADVAMARYHDPHRLDELLHAIRDGIQEKTISSWERRVFETRMTFVRTNGRKPSMEVLTALVKGRPGTEKEIDAVKHTYYSAVEKLKAHLTRLKHWP